MQAPVMVLNTNTKRETGRTAQLGNIMAAKAVSDIIRTTLGPRSMLKMLLDPMGGIVMTNDGNCILREVDVSHPAAKSMIELSRAQDEEVRLFPSGPGYRARKLAEGAAAAAAAAAFFCRPRRRRSSNSRARTHRTDHAVPNPRLAFARWATARRA